MGFGLAQSNRINKPVNPQYPKKLNIVTITCCLRYKLHGSAGATCNCCRQQGRAARSTTRLDAADLRRSRAGGSCELRRAGSSATARPAGAARSASARAGAAERCWSHASWSCELFHHAGGVKLRRGGLLTASNFSWSWMCRSLEETRLEAKTKISAVVRTEEVRGLVSVVVSVE